jgi:Ser/Thr protein kinase RdoA (MazF antagonist)
VTKHLAWNKEDMLVHDTAGQLLDGRKGRRIKRSLDEFDDDSYRIIFKDLTLSNIVLAESGDIYFLDFQKIYYYAPFYYDLARFIDTGKVFSLVRRPLFFLLNFSSINCALKSFLDGYGGGVDEARLKMMQYLHRVKHIQIKANKSKLDSLILKLIYYII